MTNRAAMGFPIVLCYHQILIRPRPEHWFFRHCCTLEAFRAEMEHVRRHCAVLSVPELAQALEAGRELPRRAAVLTFDDGYRGNLEAARLLHELGLPGCFFVTAGTIDSDLVPFNLQWAHLVTTRSRRTISDHGQQVDLTQPLQRRRWCQRIYAELCMLRPPARAKRLAELAELLGSRPLPTDDPDYRFLTGADLRTMRGLGMTIGSHGLTHDILVHDREHELETELHESQQRLAALLAEPIEFFAYPDGQFGPRARELARQHYRLAFTIGLRGSPHDRWALPRRGADALPIRTVLSRRYLWRMRLAAAAKRVLRLG